MDSGAPISSVFEFILAILILFVSIIWIIFPFIVMNRMRGIREEIINSNRSGVALIQEVLKGNQFLSQIASAQKTPPPKPRNENPKLNISKRGEDIGRMDIPSIKAMLKRGELTLQDHYLDAEINEWVSLDCHPEFC